LRESYREGTKVCKRTLANLSGLPAYQIDSIRATLRGEILQPVAQTFEVTRSLAHGHVQAVQLSMQRLGFASLLASKPFPERDLVQAMVASRILCPATKLATTRLWHTRLLGVASRGGFAGELHGPSNLGPHGVRHVDQVRRPVAYYPSNRRATC